MRRKTLRQRLCAALDLRPRTWRRRDGRLACAAAAIVASVPACAGLLLHTLGAGWLSDAERVLTGVAAAGFALGAALLVLQRTAGLFVLLGAAGAVLPLLAEAWGAVTFHPLSEMLAQREPAMSRLAACATPAALAALVAFAAFVPAMARFLRRG